MKITEMRLLNIRIFDEDKIVYEGMTENVSVGRWFNSNHWLQKSRKTYSSEGYEVFYFVFDFTKGSNRWSLNSLLKKQ